MGRSPVAEDLEGREAAPPGPLSFSGFLEGGTRSGVRLHDVPIIMGHATPEMTAAHGDRLSDYRECMIGRTIAHYDVIEAIGSGGMGEVYRVTDTKLSRDVAVKVLPTERGRN